MIRRLQTFRFNRSPYERPNQKWVCGRAAEGCPCRIGPDRRGRCRAVAECTPRGSGAGWACGRARSAGGPCEEGPRPDGGCAHPIPPCQPVRSVRARRGLVARWAAAVAVGVVTLVLYGPDAAGWLSPGTLTAAHTQLEDCSACHQDFEGGPTGWIHAAFSGSSSPDDGGHTTCLSCHRAGAEPMKPHGVASARLPAPETSSGDASVGPIDLKLANALAGSPVDRGDDLACASCHAEHEGREVDLTAMDDDRCQSCHARQFESLSNGHPEFDAYPYERRTRINFDHVAHVQRHFPDADIGEAPQRCVDCHRSSDQGQTMAVRDFGTACASCHAGEVRGENATSSVGIPVITVPGLDLPSLRTAGARIGEWPDLSDRELTPFMQAVFAGDPELSDALDRYLALDPFDLRDATEAEIDAVERIAWATKTLIHDLAVDGPSSLRPAFQAGFGREIGRARVSDLLGGIGFDTVRQAQEEWFPALASEIARYRAGDPVPMPGTGDSAPAGESGDPGAVAADQNDTDDEAGGDDILGGGNGGSGGGILGGDEPQDGDGDDILGGAETESDGGDDILGGAETESDGGDDILGGGETEGDDGGDLLGGGDGETGDPDRETGAEATLPDPDPEEWGRLGGWYRDFYALLYRPGGHADRFLKGWLDITGAIMTDGDRRAAGDVFDTLADPDGPGRCIKCHSVDAPDDDGPRVNWAAAGATPGYQDFTGFDHGPHFTLLTDDEGCATCHTFDRDNDFAASFDDRDPGTYHSNFKPIERTTCVDCHNDQQAGDTCTQCHNYHVGEVTSEPTHTRIDGL